MSVPTLQQTHDAKRTYLDGFAEHYPGMDPSLHLLPTDHAGRWFNPWNPADRRFKRDWWDRWGFAIGVATGLLTVLVLQ